MQEFLNLLGVRRVGIALSRKMQMCVCLFYRFAYATEKEDGVKIK